MEETQAEKYPKPGIVRALYMVVFMIAAKVASLMVCLIAIFQFIYIRMTEEPNEKLNEFTSSLGEYIKQIVAYLSFNTEQKPWPMNDWPDD